MSSSNSPKSTTKSTRFQPLATGEIIGGRYEVLAYIGGDSWIQRYTAKDLQNDKIVGLTTATGITPESGNYDPLLWAVNAASRLENPNIVKVREALRDDEKIVVIGDHVVGTPLEFLLRGKRREQHKITPLERLKLALELVVAMARAHKIMPHGALSARSIILGNQGAWWIMDFGVARVLAVNPKFALAHPGACPSSFISGDESQKITPTIKSDIYAMGALIYEIINLQPWEAEHGLNRLEQHALGVELSRIIQKCRKSLEDEGYEDCEYLLDELRIWVENARHHCAEGWPWAGKKSGERKVPVEGGELEEVEKVPAPPMGTAPAVPPSPASPPPFSPVNPPAVSPASSPGAVRRDTPPQVPFSLPSLQKVTPPMGSKPSAKEGARFELDTEKPVWMYQKEGFDFGPFTRKEMVEHILADELDVDSFLMNTQTGKRCRLSEVREFNLVLEEHALDIAEDYQRRAGKEQAKTLLKFRVQWALLRFGPVLVLLIISLIAVHFALRTQPASSGYTILPLIQFPEGQMLIFEQSLDGQYLPKLTGALLVSKKEITGTKIKGVLKKDGSSSNLNFEEQDESSPTEFDMGEGAGRQLSQAEIDDVITKARSGFKGCLGQGFPSITQDVHISVSFKIKPTGGLGALSIQSSSPYNPAFPSCIKGILSGIQLKPFEGGSHRITLPMVLRYQ
jgi:hypothetical protein